MVDMSIIDENEIDVVTLQKELNELREENRKLRQEQMTLGAWKNQAQLWSKDIDNLYLMMYGTDGEKNEHDKMMRIMNALSTKKGKLLLKFLI